MDLRFTLERARLWLPHSLGTRNRSLFHSALMLLGKALAYTTYFVSCRKALLAAVPVRLRGAECGQFRAEGVEQSHLCDRSSLLWPGGDPRDIQP